METYNAFDEITGLISKRSLSCLKEDMNKGGHITLKHEQNDAYLQHNHGSPPNAWRRCTDAFGNQISTCMQSPTNGL